MLRQNLSQKLLQKLSPQQIQLMKMLQLPTIALEQRIKEELEANPALEEGEEVEEEENKEDEDIISDETGDDENEDGLEKDDFSVDEYINEDEGESYKTKANNSSADDERREIPVTSAISLQEILENQLGLQGRFSTSATTRSPSAAST